ncbi:MAG: glycosyltransferase family 2 protein [Chitinophagaceae bacterium]
MSNFSIVVIVKDAQLKIRRLLESVEGLTDDVIICDTGSCDKTTEIAKEYGVQVFSIPWEGYGKSKNKAIEFAKYEWILSLDSDEKIDSALRFQLMNWQEGDPATVYRLKWKNFFGSQWIRHSDWGCNWKGRLFNKRFVRWDNAVAHEDLVANISLKYVRVGGYLEHYSFKDEDEYACKMAHSATITALKYYELQKQSTYLHVFIAPLYSFIKTYVCKMGFLDRGKGWLIAKTTAHYTFKKYAILKDMNQQKNARTVSYTIARNSQHSHS